MNQNIHALLWAFCLFLILGLLGWWMVQHSPESNDLQVEADGEPITFICSEGDSFRAAFSDDSMALLLNDGRDLTLSRDVSGSGARYTNSNEGIVFWNKGNTAFITKNDSMTYHNCVLKGEDDLTNLKGYQNEASGIRLRYPAVLQKYHESMADTSGWSYESAVNGSLIVQFKLADSLQSNSNLSEATFTVGMSNDAEAIAGCMQISQQPMAQADSVQRSHLTFLRSQYAEGAAGNRYEIRRYRALYKNSCYSIEQMVHSTNIHNYPPERGITPFDSTRVWKVLNVPWQTFAFTDTATKDVGNGQ